MRRTPLLLASGLLTFAVGISITALVVNHEPVSVPPPAIPINYAEVWQRIPAGKFSFSIPPSMQQQAARGLDASVWSFRDNSINLSVTWGLYTDDLAFYAGQPSYAEEKVTIDGREARLCSFQPGGTLAAHFGESGKYVAAVYFPHPRRDSPSTLTLWAVCSNERDLETAKQIFRTVRFE